MKSKKTSLNEKNKKIVSLKEKKTLIKKDSESKSIFSPSFIIYLVIIFLIVQIIGLFVTSYYASLTDLRIALITDDPNDLINAVFIIVQILVVTGIILLIKRFSKKTGYLRIFEYMALFVGMTVVFDVIFSEIAAMYLSVLLLFIKYLLEKYKPSLKLFIIWYNNILLAISIAGAGAIIGLSLGLIPVITFLILLSIYDIIAVFYTKHMITLAKTFSKTKMALIFYIPTKEKTYQLGGGDLVIPLVVSSSFYFYLIKLVTLNQAFLYVSLIWLASLLGLFITFYILKKYNLKAMPALPLQALLMVVLMVFIISFCI
jgi:presenilin-like A22 family membrane protease